MKTQFRIIYWLCLMLAAAAWAGTTSYPPTDDSFADEYVPSSTNGSLYTTVVRNIVLQGFGIETDIKFDLSGIPPQSTVTSARLYMYYWHYNDYDPVGQTIEAHRNLSVWEEETLCWNNRPNYSELAVSAATVPQAYGWMNWDLTNEVQEIVSQQQGNQGWTLLLADGGYSNAMIYFYSKEHGDPALRPYLEVTLGGGSGGACGDWGYPAGDINRDCYVNLQDFAILATDWLTCTDPQGTGCLPGPDTMPGVGFAFNQLDTTGPAKILTLYTEDNAGILEPNDVIIEYREEPVANGAELFSVIQTMPEAAIGEPIPMVIQRGGGGYQVVYPITRPIVPRREIMYTDNGHCTCNQYSDSYGTWCACGSPTTTGTHCWDRTVSYIMPAWTGYPKYMQVSTACYNIDTSGNKSNICLAYPNFYIVK